MGDALANNGDTLAIIKGRLAYTGETLTNTGDIDSTSVDDVSASFKQLSVYVGILCWFTGKYGSVVANYAEWGWARQFQTVIYDGI